MQPSTKADQIRMAKILKYITDIGECFKHFNITDHGSLKSERLSQFAVTQIITNIYELKKKLTPQVLLDIPNFDKIKLAGARNIASHDYEQINFRMIYDICVMLTSEKIVNELSGVMDNASREHS
jgi:uncharacterized protein with HEPN domain